MRTKTKMNAVPLFIVAIALLFPTILHAQNLLFKLSGYNFVDGLWEEGSTVTVVGDLTPPLSGPSGFKYPIQVDFTRNEYTFVISDLVISSYAVTDLGNGVIQKGTTFSGGFLRIYEDPSMNSTFGVLPPNTTCPATFEDGTLILTANLENIDSWLFGSIGSLSASVLFTEGVIWEEWWAVIALAEAPTSSAPLGFAQDFAGNIEPKFSVGSVNNLSFEALKSLFR